MYLLFLKLYITITSHFPGYRITFTGYWVIMLMVITWRLTSNKLPGFLIPGLHPPMIPDDKLSLYNYNLTPRKHNVYIICIIF